MEVLHPFASPWQAFCPSVSQRYEITPDVPMMTSYGEDGTGERN